MVKPYLAIACQPTIWDNEGDRRNNFRNIKHLEQWLPGVIWLAGMEAPVRLIGLPEGWLQGYSWADPENFLHMSATEYAHKGAITIPGEETEAIGKIAKKYGVYIRFHGDTVFDFSPDFYDGVSIIVDPDGKIVNVRERHHSSHYLDAGRTTPHDLWDEWVKHRVKNQDDWKSWMDALFPVADTEIGKLGCIICGNAMYPEEGRGLAINGAEVIIHCNLAIPQTTRDLDGGAFTLTSRMHAVANTMYTVNPATGDYHFESLNLAGSISGGYSHITDYFGRILNITGQATDTFAAAIIDIEAVRQQREKVPDILTNPLGMIRTEVFRKIYEQEFFPKNLYIKRPEIVGKQKEIIKVLKDSCEETFFKRGLWKHSATYEGE